MMPLENTSALKGFRFSKHRIEGLSDGVFAIVMTLLVLELKPPELPKTASNEEIIAKLLELLPALFSFVLSFILAGLYWFLHHSSFQFIRHVTRTLIWINLAFLMFVSLLPFSAALLGHFIRFPIAAQVYYGNQMAIGLLVVTSWLYAGRQNLLAEDMNPLLKRRLTWRLWIPPLGCAGALIVSFYKAGYASYGFLAAIGVWRLVGKMRDKSASI
jgi:uncharacterized membrane protein